MPLPRILQAAGALVLVHDEAARHGQQVVVHSIYRAELARALDELAEAWHEDETVRLLIGLGEVPGPDRPAAVLEELAVLEAADDDDSTGPRSIP